MKGPLGPRWTIVVACVLCSLAHPAFAVPSPFARLRAAADRPALAADVDRIARAAIADALHGRPPREPHARCPLLRRPAALFVTLVRQGKVRGCMGAMQCEDATAAREIARLAVLAATADTRYPRLRLDELPRVEIRVSFVGPKRRVRSLSELDPLRLGLMVEHDGRGAVLLPGEALAPGWQVAECKRKAGIPSAVDAVMYVFPTVVVKQEALP